MATLTIQLDEQLQLKLHSEAARHGRSIEEEAHAILRKALETDLAALGLGSRIHRRFASIQCAELEVLQRTEPAKAAKLAD